MDWNTFLTPLFFVQLLAASVSLATPLVLAALGEIFAQRSGVLNLGLEGIMLFSGFIGFSVVFQLNNLWAGMLAAIMIGALMGLLYAFLAISLHSNQCVTGLSLMSLGTGMALLPYAIQDISGNTKNSYVSKAADSRIIQNTVYRTGIFQPLNFHVFDVCFSADRCSYYLPHSVWFTDECGRRIAADRRYPGRQRKLHPLSLRCDRGSAGRTGRSILLTGGIRRLFGQHGKRTRFYRRGTGYLWTLGSALDPGRRAALRWNRCVAEPAAGAGFSHSIQLFTDDALCHDHHRITGRPSS